MRSERHHLPRDCRLSRAFKRSLERRIRAVLEWYEQGAVVCDETLRNLNRELSQVLAEECVRFDVIAHYRLCARFDGNVVVVRAIDMDAN